MQTAQAVADKLQGKQVGVVQCYSWCFAPQTPARYSVAYTLVQIVPVKELRERHLGILEGLTRSQAAMQYPIDFANLSGAPDAKPQARKLVVHCIVELPATVTQHMWHHEPLMQPQFVPL